MAKFKRGSWVKRNDDIGDQLNYWNRPYYRVKKVYEDCMSPGEDMFDAEVYAHDGTFIGRASEPLNGPKKFEPCLCVDDFTEVPAPPWVNTIK